MNVELLVRLVDEDGTIHRTWTYAWNAGDPDSLDHVQEVVRISSQVAAEIAFRLIEKEGHDSAIVEWCDPNGALLPAGEWCEMMRLDRPKFSRKANLFMDEHRNETRGNDNE